MYELSGKISQQLNIYCLSHVQFHSSSTGMETVTTYLESGSINGLNHIAATKRWDRLFWILVVNGGFIISTFLIVQMYMAWGDNPIRTDVDTLPMSEVTFPKVTVCPPKGTFTDLNYDIKRAEKKNLTLKEREELSEYARDTIERNSFMEYLNRLQYEDRFYNWYYAISQIEGSKDGSTYNFLSKDHMLKYEMDTVATSGVITSPFFGQKFDENLFFETEMYKSISIYVHPPDTFFGNEQNLILNYHLKKVSVPGLSGDVGSSHTFQFPVLGKLGDDKNTAYSTISSTVNKWDVPFLGMFSMNQDLRKVNIRDLEMDQMPGFNFSWWYTGGDVEPGNIYKSELNYFEQRDEDTYQEFVRDV